MNQRQTQIHEIKNEGHKKRTSGHPDILKQYTKAARKLFTRQTCAEPYRQSIGGQRFLKVVFFPFCGVVLDPWFLMIGAGFWILASRSSAIGSWSLILPLGPRVLLLGHWSLVLTGSHWSLVLSLGVPGLVSGGGRGAGGGAAYAEYAACTAYTVHAE